MRIPAFVDDGVAIPSPRQLRPFLAAHGPEATARLIHRMAGQDPGNPLFHPVAGMSLFYELHITGQREAALVLWEAYRQAVPDLVGSFVASAELFLRLGGSENRTDYARTCLEVAGLLDPGNEKARSLREKHGLPQPAVPSPG